MSEDISTEKKENEVDLLQWLSKGFQAIGKGIVFFCKNIGKSFIALLRFKIRHFRLLFICFLLGIGGGIGLFISSGGVYKGEAMVRCNGFDAQTMELQIQKLNNIIQQNDVAFVGSLLGIDPQMAKYLKNIQMGYGIDLDEDDLPDDVSYKEKGKGNIVEETFLKGKTGEEGILLKKVLRGRIPNLAFLKLHTSCENPKDFIYLGDAILRYIKNDQILNSSYQNNRKTLEAEIAQLNTQIMLLDSLQVIEYIEGSRKKNQNQNNNDKIVFASYQEKDRQLFHEQYLSLCSQKNKLEENYRLQNVNITVLSPFQPISEYISLIISLLIGIILFAFIGFGIGIYQDHKKRILLFIKESKNNI